MSITSIITLNQLINWFQNFQQNHYILNDFGFGEPYDIGTSRQMLFPYMWVTMNEDSSIAQVGHNKTAIPEVSFSIMFMDKINIQENYLDTNGFPSDNSQEILSDMIQCLQDLITHIQQDWIQYGVFVSQDISFFPAVDETPDKATGVVARFVLKLKQVNCIIPEAPTQVVVQPQQATFATLLTCETLLDCNNFQTFAYTGMTFSGGTLTLNSINGSQISVSGITGGGGGTSGTSGTSGVSGTSGTSGGGSGTSGTSGVNGTSGVSGSSGTSGVSGTNGTSGTSSMGVDGAISSRWTWDPSSPSSGNFTTNDSTISNITTIDISIDDMNAIDYTVLLLKFQNSGYAVTITDVTNNSITGTWDLSSVVNNTTYFRLNLNNNLGSNGSLNPGSTYSISFNFSFNGTSGTSGIAPLFSTQGTVQTTDNTPTVVASISTVTDTVYTVEGWVTGSYPISAVGGKCFAVVKNRSGVLTLLGGGNQFLYEDASGFPTFTIGVSGTNIQLLVTGQNGSTVNWYGLLTYTIADNI